MSKSKYNELVLSYENLHSRYQRLVKTNRKLTAIRQHLPLPDPGILIASISRRTTDGQRSEIVINRGSNDGLKKGQYVLSAERGCVIGTISELTSTMSRVKLVTDSNHYIMVDIWRGETNLKISGQMQGNNKMRAKIPLVETDYDIQENDSVFAKVTAGLLETSVIIGKITKIEEDKREPLLWDITVTPIIDIRSLTDVAVVVIDMNTSDADEGN